MNTKAKRPEPNSGILDIARYIPGKSEGPQDVVVHKLSANETPLGPSPLARAAYEALSADLADYPDGSASELCDAIAQAHGLNADNILCGNGSDELLGLLAQCYLRPGDEAIYSAYGFLVYRIAILASGATPVVTPEKDFTADVDAMLAAVTDRTKIIFLANPNNPTGTYLPMSEVRRLHAGLPDHVLLVLDAAYAEYVRRNDYESGLELVSSSQNVVMTRTFSKIHGLAALRIGWMYAPDHIIDVLDRVRGPFNVNAAALAAAQAAIGDRQTVDKAQVHNDEWLAWTTDQIRKLGLRVVPSVGNFILILFEDAPAKTAREADVFLTQRGFVLRSTAGYGLPNALRMTIGTREACEGTVAALAEFLSQADG